jgi:hypothetical protein
MALVNELEDRVMVPDCRFWNEAGELELEYNLEPWNIS